MRIGVLTTSYPREEDDPAGGFVAGFARWLAAHVGEVEVLAADGARPLFYRGGAPHALERGPRGWLHAAGFSSSLLLEAARRARRWDALVSHWLVPAGAIGLALGRTGVLGRERPHLAIAHGSDVRLLARLPGGRAFVRSLSRRADLVYVAAALAVDGAPGRVQPMGIDVAALAGGDRERARAALGLARDQLCALSLGRLAPEKGLDLAIDALPEGLTLLIAGAGPERARLEARAQALGKPVRFLGEVRGEPKRALLAAADLLVQPSRAEGAPVAVLEALACGLPVVATRAGGLAELVRDGVNGLLTDATVRSLASALARLQHEPLLRARLAAAAREAGVRHDWQHVGPALAGRLLPTKPSACPPRLQVARV